MVSRLGKLSFVENWVEKVFKKEERKIIHLGNFNFKPMQDHGNVKWKKDSQQMMITNDYC